MARRYTEPTMALLRLLYRLRYVVIYQLEVLMLPLISEDSTRGRLDTLMNQGLVAKATVRTGYRRETYWYLTARGWRMTEEAEGVPMEHRVKPRDSGRFDIGSARHYAEIAEIYIALTSAPQTWTWLSHYRLEYGHVGSGLAEKPGLLYPDAVVDLGTHRVYVEIAKQSMSLSLLRTRLEKYQEALKRGSQRAFLVVVSQSPRRIEDIRELITGVGLPAVVVTRDEVVAGMLSDTM